MKFETGKILYKCLKNLVKVTHYMQNNWHKMSHSISGKQWAKEFCTIRLQTARRSGHDYSIVKFIKKHPELNIALISIMYNMGQNIKRVLKENKIQKMPNLTCVNGLENLKGARIDCIICNGASMMSKKQIESIYDFGSIYITKNPKFLFIFIG